MSGFRIIVSPVSVSDKEVGRVCVVLLVRVQFILIVCGKNLSCSLAGEGSGMTSA